MSRVLAIDYGTKRVGIAVTDPLKIIATALDTVHSKDIYDFLKKYTKEEEIETIVVGMPKRLNNQDTHVTSHVVGFVRKLKNLYPKINIEVVDERFTSKIAYNSIIKSGINRKKRAEKGLIDQVSATIILQSYLAQKTL